MKILFLANRVPYPPYRGDKLKIFNLAKRLKSKHELYLLTFAQSEEDFIYKDELLKIFHEVHFVYLPKWKSVLNCFRAFWDFRPLQVLYFQSTELQNMLNELLLKHRFDAIHVQHLRMAPYLENRKDLPRILDLPDAFSLYWKRRKKVKRGFFTKIFQHFEQQRVLKYEKVLKEYNLSLVCSEEDKEYLEHSQNANNLRLLPNGVDLDTYKSIAHDYSQNKTILFTGNMDYAPNIDAVIYFTNSILPLIKEKIPDVKFIIAGQRPVKKVLALKSNDITVTGFIKNLATAYSSASVVVAPLRFGAGTQNKVLEAMAMGVPVVCSNIGFKGLGITSGEGVIMQTEPEPFADSVIEILLSTELRQSLGQKGKEIIKTKFDWDNIALILEQYLMEVANQ